MSFMVKNTIILLVTISSLLFCPVIMSAQYYGGDNGQKLDWALYYLDTDYVDTVNTTDLTEVAIRSILEQLDPFSYYQSIADFEQQQNYDKGNNYVGIGINFYSVKDTAIVTYIVPDGPASSAGMVLGDKILSYDGISLIGQSYDSIVSQLRGDEGTQVRVSVLGVGGERKEYLIKRGMIPLIEVDAAYMIDSETAYIKMNRFTLKSVEEFKSSLVSIDPSLSFSRMVLDFRGNIGGVVDASIELADHFLEGDKLIMYTDGKSMDRTDYPSKLVGDFEDIKVVLLVDQYTASAAEIFAGAMQDWSRALIIGQHTFGKGLIQQSYTFNDGSALRMTIGRYYTPLGRFIQKPYDKMNEVQTVLDLSQSPNGFTSGLVVADSLRASAFNKRPLIDIGGIVPDLYMAPDPLLIDSSFQAFSNNYYVFDFATQFISKNRDRILREYSDYTILADDEAINLQLIEAYLEYCLLHNLGIQSRDLLVHKEAFLTQCKSWIGSQIWGFDAYYYIVNASDSVYKRAIECLDDDSFRQARIEKK